jgi:hypothetical protein
MTPRACGQCNLLETEAFCLSRELPGTDKNIPFPCSLCLCGESEQIEHLHIMRYGSLKNLVPDERMTNVSVRDTPFT